LPGQSTWPSGNVWKARSSSTPIANGSIGTPPDGSCAVSLAAPESASGSDRTLRHAFITAALDAGVPLRDVQEAASHADPRTTMRYDRGRQSLDRHATYIVATFIAGAAR
jgi:integrase